MHKPRNNVKSRDTRFILSIGENTLTSVIEVAKAFKHYLTGICFVSTKSLNSLRKSELLKKGAVPVSPLALGIRRTRAQDIRGRRGSQHLQKPDRGRQDDCTWALHG